MPEGIVVKVEGLKELREQVLALARRLAPEVVEPVLLRHAQTIAEEARRRAPVQAGPKGGTLRRSIICQSLGRIGNNPAAAMIAVDKKSDPRGRLANYARLVEYGGGIRVAKQGRYSGRAFGKMPEQPFLRPAFDAKKREVMEGIARDLGAEVDKAVRQ